MVFAKHFLLQVLKSLTYHLFCRHGIIYRNPISFVDMVSFIESNIWHINILSEYYVHAEGVIQIGHVAFICWFPL
jgi:hypothetical protein